MAKKHKCFCVHENWEHEICLLQLAFYSEYLLLLKSFGYPPIFCNKTLDSSQEFLVSKSRSLPSSYHTALVHVCFTYIQLL